MFEELLPSSAGEDELPYDLLVEKTEGYSGSDIRLVCKEAAMQPLRRLMMQLENCQEVVPEDGIFSPILLFQTSYKMTFLAFLCATHIYKQKRDNRMLEFKLNDWLI